MTLTSNNISVNCAQSSEVTNLRPSNRHIFTNRNDTKYHNNSKFNINNKNSKNDSGKNKNIKKSKISSSTNE
jgi:hypothetical protein